MSLVVGRKDSGDSRELHRAVITLEYLQASPSADYQV